FFFFQAEDGIRDRNVTGVQTCALPISAVRDHRCQGDAPKAPGARLAAVLVVPPPPVLLGPLGHARGLLHPVPDPESAAHPCASRSEERRVGKECRAGGAWER